MPPRPAAAAPPLTTPDAVYGKQRRDAERHPACVDAIPPEDQPTRSVATADNRRSP